MPDIKLTLKDHGLDAKEIELYLSSLALGESGMAELARDAGIKRSTAYLTFKSLEQKGLMGSFRMRKGLRFVATRPEALKARAEKQMHQFEQIIPELKALAHKPDGRPTIIYYEGLDGYMVALEDTLRKPGIILRHIGSLTEMHKMMSLDFDLNYFLPKRLRNKIPLRALYFSDVKDRLKGLDDAKDRKSTRLNSSHVSESRMPSSA